MFEILGEVGCSDYYSRMSTIRLSNNLVSLVGRGLFITLLVIGVLSLIKG